MRNVTVEERRARLAHRHRLADSVQNPVEATASMIGLHSSDPSTVFLSIAARVPEVTVEEIGAR